MHSSDDTDRLLASFADHLLRHRLADERRGKFMVNWVRGFLGQPPPNPGATADECLQAYQDYLEKRQLPDWQVEQSRQSVTAWFQWRARQSDTTAPLAPKVAAAPDGSVDPAAALGALEQTLRTRHYAYRTEQTYMDWSRRFFEYLAASGRVAGGRPVVSKDACSDFISHLATRLNVGAVTQNQAFSAVLFLVHWRPTGTPRL
ncbi:MAG: site-specific integrase [bacterium]